MSPYNVVHMAVTLHPWTTLVPNSAAKDTTRVQVTLCDHLYLRRKPQVSADAHLLKNQNTGDSKRYDMSK